MLLFVRNSSALLVTALIVPTAPAFGAEQTGEQVYRQHCARCHGATGEGTKKYEKPLAGNKEMPVLARYVAKSMPEDEPGKLSAGEAERVANYINDAFYSQAARERNKPPRIELARLTVGQYRNAIADLIGSFRTPARSDDRHGLRGEYFDGRNFRGDKRTIDRIDPEVQFDFGTSFPTGGKFGDPRQFSIRWEGSVLAPETGEYEFIVRTEHATRLWVNDTKQMLIDAWVKSGSDNEYRATIFLLAGRTYPLKLEFSKAKQGVDDSKKEKDKPPVKASAALLWKRPRQAVEVIPARQLSPTRAPEAFVITTPFPPDDRSLGWERGTTVSKEWESATTEAAIETTTYVVAHLAELSGVPDNAADRAKKLREFASRFAERAFRQPLTDEQKKLFVERQFEATKDPETAVKLVVLLVLKSPRFLYREVGGGPDAFNTACRLSFALWDAPPDKDLLDSAAAGKLASRADLVKQAERMVANPRASAKMREFFYTWLKLDRPIDLAKDTKRFPGFDAAVASDLRTSLELFLDDVMGSEASDFRQLLLADNLYLNGRLATYYGVDLPANAPFQKAKLNPEQRAGVLTHPYLLSTFAYTGTSSPIHRGVFVARGVLGVQLRPPPDAFTPFSENLHPTLTTRERVALQTKPANCQSCHGVINPLGYPLENFDAVGRYREKDNNKPVDATGSYRNRIDDVAKFTGARELAKYLANSDEVHAAFVEHLFHHLIKQPVRAYGPKTAEELKNYFVKNGLNMRKLAIEIAVRAALPPTSRPDK
jgi:mono/diheme cytochrome c family protein